MPELWKMGCSTNFGRRVGLVGTGPLSMLFESLALHLSRSGNILIITCTVCPPCWSRLMGRRFLPNRAAQTFSTQRDLPNPAVTARDKTLDCLRRRKPPAADQNRFQHPTLRVAVQRAPRRLIREMITRPAQRNRPFAQ